MLGAGEIWALGAMSGTSLDGVDAAMVRTDGVTIAEFGSTSFQPYSKAEQQILRAALGKTGGVDAVASLVEDRHVQVLSQFEGYDLIGFHGQTLSHQPLAGKTYQAGNGAVLANALQRPVVWDFRSADMELGGQGAPLAPFFHFAAAKWFAAKKPLAIVNIGGVANLTYIDPTCDEPTDEGAILAFDTGPGNAQLNDFMSQRSLGTFDKDGALAAKGQINASALRQILQPGYFSKMPPKSLDRDDFSFLSRFVTGLSDADGAATLTAATSGAIELGMQHCPKPPERLLVTGGGRKNATLMGMLQKVVSCPVQPIERVGLDGDMLEAQAFAYLAVRVARGLPTSGPSTTGVAAAIGGGQISYPNSAAVAD